MPYMQKKQSREVYSRLVYCISWGLSIEKPTYLRTIHPRDGNLGDATLGH